MGAALLFGPVCAAIVAIIFAFIVVRKTRVA